MPEVQELDLDAITYSNTDAPNFDHEYPEYIQDGEDFGDNEGNEKLPKLHFGRQLQNYSSFRTRARNTYKRARSIYTAPRRSSYQSYYSNYRPRSIRYSGRSRGGGGGGGAGGAIIGLLIFVAISVAVGLAIKKYLQDLIDAALLNDFDECTGGGEGEDGEDDEVALSGGKSINFKSDGMPEVTPAARMKGEGRVMMMNPMNVMCGKCGDIGETKIVALRLSCVKNWLCNPFPCALWSGCKELNEYEHYCANCGTCIAVCEKYKKPKGCNFTDFERTFPASFGQPAN